MTITCESSATRTNPPTSEFGPWRPHRVPDQVRLTDENPLTGRPYACARSYDLPPYVLDAIENELDLTSCEWNHLVDTGAVLIVAGAGRSLSLAGFLDTVRARGEQTPPGRTCGDCWGTLATHDSDASVTGCADAVYLCICAEPTTTVPPSWW